MADDERVSIPIGAGTVVGIACWILGYLVTYLGTVDSIREDLRTTALETVLGEGIGWQVVGWLFYNAHGVDVRFPGTDGFQFVAENYNYVAADDGSLWLLFFLPPAVLALGGTTVAWHHRIALRTPTDAAIAGSTVTVGYLACSVLGLAAFAVGVSDDVIRPDPIAATVLAGAAYPIVFGGLGGALASVATARDPGRTSGDADRD